MVGILQSPSNFFRTSKFLKKASQIAEETLFMITDKPKKQYFKDTQVSVSMFYADISKIEEFSVMLACSFQGLGVSK